MVHGRYTVVRKLAEGGMAEIFLARQHGSEGFERLVVLKRIHSGFVADEQFRNMLIDEAHISMGLHHNNIVQVLDLGRAGGRLFLVLELVDGWDMSWLLERAQAARRPLPTGLGLYVIVEVCRALAYAHGRTGPEGRADGHRPPGHQPAERAAVGTGRGEAGRLRHRQGDDQAGPHRHRRGEGQDRLHVARAGAGAGDRRAIRSVLAGHDALPGQRRACGRSRPATDFEVLARVQKGQFIPPEDVRPDLAPSLAAVIRRAMAVDREQRYQTADELLVDLEGIWRSEFGAPGETELKLWLGELGRADGVPPIGKISFATNTRSSGTHNAGSGRPGRGPPAGTGGRREERAAGPRPHLATLGAIEEPDVRRGRGPACGRRAVAARARPAGGRAPRMTGNEPTTMSDLALSVSDESMEMMPRMAGRSRRRMVGTGFVALVLLGGAGAAAMWKMGTAAGPRPNRASAPARPRWWPRRRRPTRRCRRPPRWARRRPDRR